MLKIVERIQRIAQKEKGLLSTIEREGEREREREIGLRMKKQSMAA